MRRLRSSRSRCWRRSSILRFSSSRRASRFWSRRLNDGGGEGALLVAFVFAGFAAAFVGSVLEDSGTAPVVLAFAAASAFGCVLPDLPFPFLAADWPDFGFGRFVEVPMSASLLLS